VIAPSDGSSLKYARLWLINQANGKGAKCPCCHQFTKVYWRSINSGMARSLIAIYRKYGLEFGYIPALSAKSREEGKFVYWGMLEEAIQPRPDGGRAGYWRVTDKGEDFILRGLRVPKHALVYDGEFIRWADEKDLVNIRDCLKKHFDLDVLLGRI